MAREGGPYIVRPGDPGEFSFYPGSYDVAALRRQLAAKGRVQDIGQGIFNAANDYTRQRDLADIDERQQYEDQRTQDMFDLLTGSSSPTRMASLGLPTAPVASSRAAAEPLLPDIPLQVPPRGTQYGPPAPDSPAAWSSGRLTEVTGQPPAAPGTFGLPNPEGRNAIAQAMTEPPPQQVAQLTTPQAPTVMPGVTKAPAPMPGPAPGPYDVPVPPPTLPTPNYGRVDLQTELRRALSEKPQLPGHPPQTDQERTALAIVSGLAHPDEPLFKQAQQFLQQTKASREYEANRVAKQYELDMGAWERRVQAIRDKIAVEPTTTANLSKLEREERQSLEKEQEEKRQLAKWGSAGSKPFLEQIVKNYETAKSLPDANAALNGVRDMLDRGMFTGFWGPAKLTGSKFVTDTFGVPKDPRLANTEVFRSTMAQIIPSLRAAVGPGAQSDKELDFLERSAAGDIRLDPEAIRRVFDNLQTKILRAAREHSRLIENYGGTDENDRRTISSYRLPNGMAQFVRPEEADKFRRNLMNASSDEERRREMEKFDQFYYSPGLSQQFLSR